MKHAASRELYAYWDKQRGTRAAPERSDLEPGAIRGVLGDAFILTLEGRGGYPIRLAGTRVCALVGREIGGESFLNLWDATTRPSVASLLAVLADECVGTVAAVTARNAEKEPIDLEMLLLPLRARRAGLARAIGVLAPLMVPTWLGGIPIGPLALGSRRHVGASIDRRLLPRFLAARGRPNLVVYEGGRSSSS